MGICLEEGLLLGIRVRIGVCYGFLGLGFSRFSVRVRVSAWWLRYELGLNLVVRSVLQLGWGLWLWLGFGD